MKRFMILFLAVALTGLSCEDRDDEVGAVNIRIKNTSSIVYDEVQVGAAEEVHLNVAPDGFSEYFEYETAYTYAFIEIKSGEETYTLQPIDFVGETELPAGFYTYELNVDAEGNVQLNFKVD